MPQLKTLTLYFEYFRVSSKKLDIAQTLTQLKSLRSLKTSFIGCSQPFTSDCLTTLGLVLPLCDHIKTYTFEVPDDIVSSFESFCAGFQVNASVQRNTPLTIVIQSSMQRNTGFKIIQMADELNRGGSTPLLIEFTKAINGESREFILEERDQLNFD